ncbi:MAG: prepilin-type N-terminal cleavage/methylation domain-containing protein [Candidatus Omnitrophica bacterium]|nr:prepilin-type N-terminal cleavage/methylation domain-containing protein [Candidatus Omnitrophota bacterium]
MRENYNTHGRTLTGFTLIEFLLAITLFLVVSSSLYLALQSGLMLYKRGEVGLSSYHRTTHFLNSISRELRNAVQYSSVPFEGKKTSMSFPAVLGRYTKDNKCDDFVHIEYTFASKKLVKKEKSLSRKNEKETKTNILPSYLKNISFQYGFFSETDESIVWKDTWSAEDQQSIPQAVKVTVWITFIDNGRGEKGDKTIEKKIWIPHGQWGREENT